MDNKTYINHKLRPVLEKMVVDLLEAKPEEPLVFMQEWIKSKG